METDPNICNSKSSVNKDKSCMILHMESENYNIGTFYKISINEIKAQKDKIYFQSLKTILVREYLMNLHSKLSQSWTFGDNELIYFFFPGTSS